MWVDPAPVDPVQLLMWAVATGVNLAGAYLNGAYLNRTNLNRARGDAFTVLPDGWMVTDTGLIVKGDR